MGDEQIQLKRSEFEGKLRSNLPEDIRVKADVAFSSLSRQDDYIGFHFEEFRKSHSVFVDRAYGRSTKESIGITSNDLRTSFEAHAFAFFRALHAFVESVPYLLNLFLEVKNDTEDRHLNWSSIREFCEKSDIYALGRDSIIRLRESTAYNELEYIVNVSKHRRLIRIDSGIISREKKATLCRQDLDRDLRTYVIEDLMESLYDELHFESLKLISTFVTK